MFADIVDAYTETDPHLRTLLAVADDVGDVCWVENYSRTIELNDKAYFFLLIARFESVVKDLTKQRIKAMRAHPNVSASRAWAVISHDALFFLNHVALLTDKGGSDYRDVQELYQDRNAIAHGRLAETKPNVAMIVAKLSGILARLEGTP